jgi:hypothetical protein
MKKLTLLFVLAAMAVSIGCKTEPETRTITYDYNILNLTGSDIVVELKYDDRLTTIKPGQSKVVYHHEIDYVPRAITPVPDVSDYMPSAEMRIDGKVVSGEIWRRDHWKTRTGSNAENSNISYTLTVTDDLLRAVTPVPTLTTDYRIVNLTASDIVIEFKLGDQQTATTIKPDESRVVYSNVSGVEEVDDSADYLLSAQAGMTVDGEAAPQDVWWRELWDFTESGDDPDADQYRTYTLTLTDNLLGMLLPKPESFRTVSIYEVVNRTGSDIVVELGFGDKRVTTIKPGATEVIHTGDFTQCYDPRNPPVYDPLTHYLNAEMRIDGEVVPREIWSVHLQLWEIRNEDLTGAADACADHYYRDTYTLTVDDELMERWIRPVTVSDDVAAFFDSNSLLIARTVFKDNDEPVCMVINRADELPEVLGDDGLPLVFPDVDFDSHTLVIGLWEASPGWYIKSQHIVIKNDPPLINIITRRKDSSSQPDGAYYLEGFWGLYPKIDAKSIYVYMTYPWSL